MKKNLLYLFLCFSLVVSAQVTNEGTPASWSNKNLENISSIKLPAFDLEALKAEDAINDTKFDRPWRFGKEFSVNYNLNNAGQWSILPNGDRIWRIRFQSQGAVTMNFIFDDFYLPEGATIYLYNNDKTDLLGAYDARQNNSERVLGTWLVDGDDVWVEYFEPANVAGQGALKIGTVVHGYRSQSQFSQNKALNSSGNCNLDVDCEIDAVFEDVKNHVKKGVVILLNSNGSGFCSGSLINNANNDGTPYILTANHCFSNPANWSFRFNWISPNPVCASTQQSTNGPTTQTMSGAVLRARNAPSDFALVEINNPIPSDWDVVWNGWDNSDDIPEQTMGIHHPAGDIMKVAVDRDAPGKLTQNGNQPVWRIFNWEIGVTEGGSSGSPLFDTQGKIVGQLWRGTAACSGTTDNGGWDEYGRFGASWNDGSTSATRLRDWLDPQNSGVVSIESYPPYQVFEYNSAIAVTNVEAVVCSNVIEPVLRVRNLGSETLTSADITYYIEGQEPTTMSWTGSLETNQSEEVVLGAITINANGTFYSTIANPNGQEDEFPGNTSSSASFAAPEAFTTSQVTLTLLLDNYPEETSWEFTNSSGQVLYSGGPYAGQPGATITQTFELNDEDCYTFTIFDQYGDGICCGFGNGNYQLTTHDGSVIVQGGDFGSSESTTFSNYEVLSVSNPIAASIALYPNPSTGVVNLLNSSANELKVEVYNVLGQLMLNTKAQQGNNQLDMTALASGMYFVKIVDAQNNQSITKKLVLK